MNVPLYSCCPSSTRRRRGIAAACDKYTATLQVDLALRDFVTRCDPESFRRALSVQTGGKTRREIFSQIPEDARVLNAILHHEYDHLRRQFGTSAGLMQWAAATCLVGLFRLMMSQAAQMQPACPLPLIRWALGGSDMSEAPFDDIHGLIARIGSGRPLHSQALQALCLAAFMAEMEGDDAPPQGVAAAESGLAILDRWAGGDAAVALSDTETAARIHGRFVGARHFFEAFAIQEEANRVAALGCANLSYQKLILESEDYGWLLAAWHRRFPGLSCTRTGNTRAGDLINETWRILPVEAYAVADLALWPPFGPSGLMSANRLMQWQDVQPGWRFLQCLDVLEKTGTYDTPIGSGQRERVFDETQVLVCERLGWPTPAEVGRRWLEYFEQGRWIEAGFLLGHPNEASARIAKTVLRTRLAKPFDAVLNNLPWGQDAEMHFPIWITMEPDADGPRRHVYRAAGGTDGDATLTSYYVHTAARCFLFGERAFELFAPTHQREALGAVDRVMAGVGWQPDFLRELSCNVLGLG